MTTRVERLWYGKSRPLWPLWPLAWLYRLIAERRRKQALRRHPRSDRLNVPIVVVGNITAGGTGKSPLTAWLVSMLKTEGWQPVILTRGYGGRSDQYPFIVTDAASADVAGDEPIMLATITGCPVVVDPIRSRSAQWALDQGLGNILVCDDGLQHYALPRDIEVVVFDGDRGLGNGAPIPVGPLREPVKRLASVDFVVVNGPPAFSVTHSDQHVMTLEPTSLRHVRSGVTKSVGWLAGKSVKAVAGIGNPQRFFNTLTSLGARVRSEPFPDHHHFVPQNLDTVAGEILVMTAKDAVKCKTFAHDDCWALEVAAHLPDNFRQALLQKLGAINLHKGTGSTQ